jgi:hypothetical protein
MAALRLAGMSMAATPNSGNRGWFGPSEFGWFVTLLATALAMGAALAHALALPNKLMMSAADYFAAQQAYRGWNQLAFLLSIEMTGMIALLIGYWRSRPIRWRIVAALVCLVLAMAAFWAFTFPANLATDSWQQVPANWQVLRSQWEYSHLAGAALRVLALCFMLLALQRRVSLRARAVQTSWEGKRPESPATSRD